MTTWLIGGLALAQTAPCDDPPPEVKKCTAETSDDNRTVDLSALLGGPVAPKAASGCRRATTTVVSGNPVGVTDALAKVDAQVERCAVEARKRQPKLAGTARFDLTVDGQGQVSALAAGPSTLADAELAECLTRTFSTVRFTARPRVVQVDVGCSAPTS